MNVQVLIGSIASGKSTHCLDYPDACILDKDVIRKSIKPGEYIFDKNIEPYIHICIVAQFKAALLAGCDEIILDSMHANSKSRKYIFNLLADHPEYTVTAVIMPFRGVEQHAQDRFENNHGRTVFDKWLSVSQRFIDKYEQPSTLEGFNEIKYK